MKNLENAKRIVMHSKIAYEMLRANEIKPTQNEALLFEACQELEVCICQECGNWEGECMSSVSCHTNFSEFK